MLLTILPHFVLILHPSNEFICVKYSLAHCPFSFPFLYESGSTRTCPVLIHALAVNLVRNVRVNYISPDWIDTGFKVYKGSDARQQPTGSIGNPLDIANRVPYLCYDKADFITGENTYIDGSLNQQITYHGNFGGS